MTDEFRKLRESDPDVATVMKAFEDANSVYQETRRAMGRIEATSATHASENTLHVALTATPKSADHTIRRQS